MKEDNFYKKFQRDCKIIIIICVLLLLLLIGCVIYALHQSNETDKQIAQWDEILREAENGK